VATDKDHNKREESTQNHGCCMLVRDAEGVEEDLYSFRFTLGYVSANRIPYAQLLVGYSFIFATDLQELLSLHYLLLTVLYSVFHHASELTCLAEVATSHVSQTLW